MAAFLVTQGTQTQLANDVVGTNVYPISKIDYGAAGVSTLFTGTILQVTTISGIASGSVTGTIQQNPVPVVTPLNQGTLGTAGGSFFGTLSAVSGAGTKQYITGLSVIGQAGTVDVRILAGSAIQGTGVLGAGNVVPGGGYVRDFTNPFPTGTNAEITYHFVGAGTAFIVLNYWKGV